MQCVRQPFCAVQLLLMASNYSKCGQQTHIGLTHPGLWDIRVAIRGLHCDDVVSCRFAQTTCLGVIGLVLGISVGVVCTSAHSSCLVSPSDCLLSMSAATVIVTEIAEVTISCVTVLVMAGISYVTVTETGTALNVTCTAKTTSLQL